MAPSYIYAPAPPAPPPRDQLIHVPTSSSSSPPGTPSGAGAGAPAVNAYKATPIPGRYARQMMSRMSWGFAPDTWTQLRRSGDAHGWFEEQLRPSGIDDPQGAMFDEWYPDRTRSAADKWDTVYAETKFSWDYAVDLANWSLLRRSRSSRQLHEVMTDFWSNHLHIPAIHDLAWCWRNHYDAVLRRHALGNFDELLTAASLHPSMLLYLSNYESTRQSPNENQGRELLELHTVGREAGYTEDMVKDSARILTGYTVNVWDDWLPCYDKSSHATGPVKVLSFRRSNGNRDGREVARQYLHYLAHHPATARRIATKLALRFVSDHPSPELVSHLAQVYSSSGTNITAVLRALVRHAEFAGSMDCKVRSPIEDFVATVRALEVKALKPTADGWPFASAQIWMCQGQYPFQWPRPDGLPQTNGPWSSASQVLGSLDLHYSMSGGWIGDEGSVRYRSPISWLPASHVRFDALVDHLSRTLLARASTPRVLKAACQATGVHAKENITKDHAIVQWLMPRLLTALLDTPSHMNR